MLRLAGTIAAGTALLASAPASAQETAEAAFRAAAEYTVKIETTVSLPVGPGEEAGVFSGTGFLADAERGWIVTNAHVASRSPATLRMRAHGGAWIGARRIYVDPYLDIAIVAPADGANRAATRAATLHCDAPPAVGHPVGAFGHPWGLDFTGTRGIVAGVTDRYEPGALLTDAPINSGNSGGPLISLVTGKVVGINASGLSNEGVQNLNFAVSARYLCRILDLLRAGRDPSPLARTLIFYADDEQTGVVKVARNFMPAGQMALKPGDIIREVIGVSATLMRESELIHALRGRLDRAELRIERDGKLLELAGRLPAMERVLGRRLVYASGVVFGQARSFDPREINFSRIAACHIEPGSLGTSAGFEACDAVESVDGGPADDLEQFHRKLEEAATQGRPVRFGVKRVAGLKGKSYFEYRELVLPIEELRWLRVEDQRLGAE